MANSAVSKKKPNVTITFDGLMLFHFDDSNKRCEIMFRRADAHRIEIKVHRKQREGEPGDYITEPVKHEQLIQSDELRLQKRQDGTPGAVRGKYFDEVLQLDGKNFYSGMGTLKMKSGQYRPKVLLCIGEVGTTSVTAPCKRVTKTDEEIVSNGLTYSFDHLKYNLTSKHWGALAREFSGLIKDINPFSRWVDATIDLDDKQDLILTGKNQSGAVVTFPLIENFNAQDEYWIHIAHLDLPAPQSLGHCKGMAHLCESFKLNGQPLYGVFEPRSESAVLVPSPPWEARKKSTDVPCCLCARVEQFQME